MKKEPKETSGKSLISTQELQGCASQGTTRQDPQETERVPGVTGMQTLRLI